MSMNVYSYGVELLLRDTAPSSGGGAPPAGGLNVYSYGVEVLLIDDAGSSLEVDAASDLSTLASDVTEFAVRPASASSSLDLVDEVANALNAQSVSSDLGISDDVTVQRVRAFTVSNELSLESVGIRNLTLTLNALNELNLTQDTENNFFILSVSSEMSLTGLAHVPITYEQSLSSLMSLTQDSRPNIQNLSLSSSLDLSNDLIENLNGGIKVATSSVLSLESVATADGLPIRLYLPAGLYDEGGHLIPGSLPIYPDEQLHLNHSVVIQGPKRVSASSTMTLNQTVQLNMIKQLLLTQGLGLDHQVGRIFDLTGTSLLSFTEVAERVFKETQFLNLTQAASGFVTKIATSSLALNHTVQVSHVFSRELISEISFSSVAAYYKNVISLCQYAPQRGTNSPVPAFAPTTGTNKLTLTYPFDTPTTTLVLRNPDFGNQNSLQYQRINRTSRGGTLLIYADPLWPKQQVQSYTINALSQAQVTALLQFFYDSIGQEIGLLDHENRQWRGLIVNPDAEVTQIGQGCNFSVSFQFEGEPV